MILFCFIIRPYAALFLSHTARMALLVYYSNCFSSHQIYNTNVKKDGVIVILFGFYKPEMETGN